MGGKVELNKILYVEYSKMHFSIFKFGTGTKNCKLIYHLL